MAAEVIDCPACANQVRVPETLLGQAVRCPKCKAYLRAPTRDASGLLGTPELLHDYVPGHQAPRAPLVEADRKSLFLPGILLLLIGIVASLVNGAVLFAIVVQEERVKKAFTEMMQQYAKSINQEFKQDEVLQQFGLVKIAVSAAFAAGVLTFLGSLCILKQRFRALAVLGSVVALFNFSNGCCLFGAPVGIYCLFKLFDPEIRPLFSRR